MDSRYLIALTFVVGLGVGWFGNTWFQLQQTTSEAVIVVAAGGTQRSSISGTTFPTESRQTGPSDAVRSTSESSSEKTVIQNTRGDLTATYSEANSEARSQSVVTGTADLGEPGDSADSADRSIIVTIDDLLDNRQYSRAIARLQEQSQANEQNAASLRLRLLKELSHLIETRNNSDFSELIDNYLSVYYDDIDALFLLAEFNQVNGSYLEVVNVFLLAKTYAYNERDQEKVDRHFNKFVLEIDGSYTSKTNWASLINFYAHINTSGLMTSTYQFRQAMAYLRSGDEAFAVEQFNQLLTDSLVGESAGKALRNLGDVPEPPIIVYNSSWEGADSIALQKQGNQYVVNLDNARRDSVKLLIDTGASMTAVSTESFEIINANGDAVEKDQRVFRTANGLVRARVFSVPELNLGPHRLENTQIAVIDFGTDRDIDGLLGMNILGQFRFQIDQESSQLLLSKK